MNLSRGGLSSRASKRQEWVQGSRESGKEARVGQGSREKRWLAERRYTVVWPSNTRLRVQKMTGGLCAHTVLLHN